jgi:hypothetical protein
LTGDLLGRLLSTTETSNSTLLTLALTFIDVMKLDLNNLKAALIFKDGMVNVKPFDINYKDIKATVGGSHANR